MLYTKNKKVFMLFILIVMILGAILPFTSAKAATVPYSSGLLSGKNMNKSYSFMGAGTPTNLATDLNDTTSVYLEADWYDDEYGDFDGEDNLWYSLASPVNVKSFYVKYVGDVVVNFYNSSGTLLSSYSASSSTTKLLNNTITKASVDNVQKIAIIAISDSSVYDFEVYDYVLGSTSATTTVTPGEYELIVPTTVSFGSTKLVSTINTLSKPLGNLKVGDMTGTGKGWRLQVQASSVTNGTTPFPINSVKLAPPTSVSSTDGIATNLPTIVSGSPWFIDAGNDVTILSAALNKGMGSYNIDYNSPNALTLSVPSHIKSGSYTTNLYWKIVVGP